MKKKLSMLLILAMTGSILLTGCGTDKKYDPLIAYLDDGNYSAAISLIQDMQREALQADSGDETINTILTVDEFAALFSEQMITPENMEDYLEIVDIEEEREDQFGDKTGAVSGAKYVAFKENVGMIEGMELVMEFSYDSVETCRYYEDDGTLQNENEPYSRSDSVQVTVYSYNYKPNYIVQTFSRNEPGSTTFYVDNEEHKGYAEYTYDISNLTCTRTQGSILLAEIPEDTWNKDDKGRFLAIIHDDGAVYKYYENGEIVGEYFTSEVPEDIDTNIFYNLHFFLDGKVLSNG